MGWLGKLFGTSDAVKEIMEAGKEIADEFHYSGEEKAEDQAEMARDKAKAMQDARGMIIRWLDNTQGQNLSRRIIALSVTATWLFLYLVATFMSVAAIWIMDTAEKLNASAALIDGRSDGMTGAVMLILGFYFCAPQLGNIADKALERFGRTGK